MKRSYWTLAWLLYMFSQTAIAQDILSEDKKSSKERAFSIFNVVQFKNVGCRSQSAQTTGQSPFRNGTCFTSSECTAKGGVSSGNCASGFGVCCLFLVSDASSTISQNCTYVRNKEFPSAYAATTGISYTVAKADSGVCYLRLDFESFSILGPATNAETSGGTCVDTFKVTTTTGQTLPTVCGSNTGHHMYVDIGDQASDTATLAFTFNGASTARSWEIKVSQIECFNENRPPPGCLQYFTTYTGRITTFNFLPTTGTSHLANQAYSICIKSQTDYCCVQYQVCAGVPNAFSLDTVPAVGLSNHLCSQDYIGIPGSSATCTATGNPGLVSTKYCGSRLNPFSFAQNIPICDCTAPFGVRIFTDALTDAAGGINTATNTYSRGACLDYRLLPCKSGF